MTASHSASLPQAGHQLTQMHFELCDLALIGIDVLGNFSGAQGRLSQVLLLAFP